MKIYNKGMTLIEVIVSILIVGFVLVGMMQLYSLGAIQSGIARHKAMALNLAQAEIEGLMNTTYEGITLSTYPLTKSIKIDTGQTQNTSDDINGAMTTSISSISEGYKVIVNVSWNDYYGVINEVLESTVISYL